MPKFETLFSKYDRLVLFDTETTGLLYNRDEIIEFAAVVLERVDGTPKVVQEYDQLVALSPGGFVPPKIQELTGISTQDLRERGLPKTRVCRDIAEMIQGNTLLLAYNAHFDLSFLFYMLLRDGDPAVLKGKDKLDLLTVYRDRPQLPPPAVQRHRGLRPFRQGGQFPPGGGRRACYRGGDGGNGEGKERFGTLCKPFWLQPQIWHRGQAHQLHYLQASAL